MALPNLRATLGRLAVFVLSGAGICLAQDRGSCPSSWPPANIPKKITSPRAVNPNDKYAGSVILEVVVSYKGYVCNTRVVRGLSGELNKRAQESVQQWRFKPASASGHAVPVAIAVQADFWMNAKGEIIGGPKAAAPSSDDKPAKSN
jgi:outer membrane biosynthesis protein TonB